MPITSSAKKALRSSKRKRVVNLVNKEKMNKVVKTVKKLVVSKSKDEAKKELSLAYKAIDKAAKKGVIKKNTASRKKSRLAKAIKKLS
ncbi:MAG: 30S ribosomal protein S20 [Candidatus Paceibacterota bacterium]|jgi:small subunit ribosomal protein S20